MRILLTRNMFSFWVYSTWKRHSDHYYFYYLLAAAAIGKKNGTYTYVCLLLSLVQNG